MIANRILVISISQQINTTILIIILLIKKPVNADHSALTERTETNHKAPKIKVTDRIRIINCKNIFSKGYIENKSREIFIINSVLETNPWSKD